MRLGLSIGATSMGGTLAAYGPDGVRDMSLDGLEVFAEERGGR
jgi:hypothetical protein